MKNKSFHLFVVAAFTLASCGYTKPIIKKDFGNVSVEDLHINEPIIYNDSPLGLLVKDAFESDKHFVRVLNVGNDALLAITHLIRTAKNSINIQTFIWVDDESGMFVFNELFKAAERGVKIKIIADDLSLRKIPETVAYFATAHPNIQVKHYNPLAQSISTSMLDLLKGWGIKFSKSNRRMHNKVLIVDDQIGLLGGRNYENDYFDRGKDRNFKDRDVLVIGPEVKKMTDSFLEYWNYVLSIPSTKMTDIRKMIEKRAINTTKIISDANKTNDFFKDISECASDGECIKGRLLDNVFAVDRVEFIADKPGKNERIGKYKTTTTSNAFIKFLLQAQNEIVIQTPYLVVGSKGTKIFKQQRKRNPAAEIIISTNSLASCDHFYAYAFSFKNKKKYLKKFKWRIFELKPVPKDNDSMVPSIAGIIRSKKYFTCIHAKTFIFDSNIVWIGSFNIDPRSADLNTEIGLIIYDEKIAAAVKSDIVRDMSPQNSWTIGKTRNIPIVSEVSGLTEDVTKMVPVVDAWPFQYSSSYELIEGKEEVPFYHPKFYQNYRSVGPFPEAELTEKELKMRIIKTLFGPAEQLI